MGVITAATIRYALNIHAAVPYGMLKSCIISGMAGSSMVSEKKTTKRVLLSIPRVNHAERLAVVTAFSLSLTSNIVTPAYTCLTAILSLAPNRACKRVFHVFLELLIRHPALFFQPHGGILTYMITDLGLWR